MAASMSSGMATRSSTSKKINQEAVACLDEHWQMSKQTLWQQNEHLLKTGEFSDCVFIVGEKHKKTFKCHRLLLSKASSVFGAMLFGPLAERDSISVTDVSPSIFEIMLNYVYTGQLKMQNYLNTLDLCIVADKYMIVNLKNECIKKLGEDLSPHNVMQVHRVSKFLHMEELEQKAVKLMINRTSEVLESPNFLSASTPEQVLMLVTQDSLNIGSEAQLIKPCLKWAECEAARSGLPITTAGLRETLGLIFEHLRFLVLTEKEFSDIAETSLALSDKEKWVIMAKIIKEDFSTVPDGFSNNQIQRPNNSITVPKFTFVNNVYMSGNACQMEYDIGNTAGYGSFLYCTGFKVDSDIIMEGFTVFYNPNHQSYYYHQSANVYRFDSVMLKNSQKEILPTGSSVEYIKTHQSFHKQFKFEKPALLEKDKTYYLTVICYNSAHMQSSQFQPIIGHNMYTDENFAANTHGSMISSIVYKMSL